jgi:hypothetical protein
MLFLTTVDLLLFFAMLVYVSSSLVQYLARMLAEVKAHANCVSVRVGPDFQFTSLAEATSYAQV